MATSHTYSSCATLPASLVTSAIPNPLNASGGRITVGTMIAHDIIVDGESLRETLELIKSRLAILVPSEEKLQKYEALRNAYDQYKVIEALLNE